MGRSNISLVGNTTTGQNVGGGVGNVYLGKNTGNNLQFRTIASTGTSIQIYQVGNKILIGGGGGTGGTSYTFIPSGGTIIKVEGANVTIYSPTGGTSGGGTITGATNLGSGNGSIYTSISDKNLQFKTLSGGTNITLTSNGNYIGINTPTISVPITGATNGLSVTGKQIKLGGTLTGTTTINGAKTLNINQTVLNLSGNTCVSITGAVKLTTTPANGAASLTALLWDSGTTLIKGVPVIDEWVGATTELLYAGQKFAYDTQTILQTDVSTCVTIPNYILVQNINLKNVGNTLAFTIPVGKTALLNRAKLIILCDADPTGFKVSMGNNCCLGDESLSMNNLVSLCQIADVLTNETYDLTPLQHGVTIGSNSLVYFRVASGSTSANPLCAHLLVEGFVY